MAAPSVEAVQELLLPSESHASASHLSTHSAVASASHALSGSGSASARIPRYMRQTLSNVLPAYSNGEADRVRQSFAPGNFHAIQALPTAIGPEAVNLSREESMGHNRRNVASLCRRKPTGTYHRTFSDAAYVPSRYTLAAEIKAKERAEAQRLRMQIGGKDFVCSSATRKLKHEDGFEDKTATYPCMRGPYEGTQLQMERMRWLEDAKVLHGPFVPPGRRKCLSVPSRSLLPHVVQELHATLSKDWGDYRFSVMVTVEDNIAVRFLLADMDGTSRAGLVAYMGVLLGSHFTMDKYRLTKVVEDWNTEPGDGFLYFTFRAPWVRVHPNDTFFTLHPEERAFRRQGKT